jgi:hypothetical protein
LLKGVDFSSLLFISQSIGLSVLGANFLISFEQYSNDIGKIILHSLIPILCEINNKELKSTPLSNKNNNTATSVLKISVINSGIKNFFCIDR